MLRNPFLQCGRETNTARGEGECCIRLETMPECYFLRIAWARQCFNKALPGCLVPSIHHFGYLLAIWKCHARESTVLYFPHRSAVFTKECFMEIITHFFDWSFHAKCFKTILIVLLWFSIVCTTPACFSSLSIYYRPYCSWKFLIF